MHEITSHRIEQFKRERLHGRWRAHKQQRRAKPVQPATVNRELDTFKSILSKAVEWGILVESPAVRVKRLPVANRRTRILSLDEQRRLLRACGPRLQAIVAVALITSARIGELLALRWDECDEEGVALLQTKNGKTRRIPMSPTIALILGEQPRTWPWVFTNPSTGRPYTTVVGSFRRALARAGITTGDVTLHTLRHTALSRMIEAGCDDYTVMELSGHSSTRMLARYTHPTKDRKISALESSDVGTTWAQRADRDDDDQTESVDDTPASADIEGVVVGGPHGTRTHDLRVANAALSQLS